MSRRLALLVAGAFLTTAAPAGAEPAVGVLAGAENTLVTFDTASPHTFFTSRTVVGLAAGEKLVGIDYRYAPSNPATPALIGVAATVNGVDDDLRVYSLDPSTGVATVAAAATSSFTHGTTYGIAFNHTVDRIRVVNDAEENGRINPFTGLRADATDTDL